MAGSGRRVFAPGEVLTASNTMNYLMDQTVMNFASTAARGSAIGTAVSEGMVSYLNDTDSLEVYQAIGTAAPGWQPVAFQSYANRVTGTRPIIPTGVTVSTGSGSFNSITGEVTFTNARDINVAGIFTSAYKFYELVYNTDGTTAADVLLAWFTNAGTNISSGWYGSSFFNAFGGGTGNVYSRNNGNGGVIGQYSAANTIHRILTYYDSTVSDKLFQYQAYNIGNAEHLIGGYSTAGTADGFRINPNTAGRNISGTIRINGWN
jgi:hypothetical protein